MKKALLLIVLIISGFIGFAQLEVKEGSFKKVDGFVNINIEKMYDDNDKPYAVLKIRTENINDKQRRQLGFGGDAQTFFETEYKDGEIWLYISYYATFLKISHPDLSSTEFWFPYDMEPKRGYELTLVYKPAIDEEIISRIEKLENASNENETKYGYIIITTPTDGATVYINGKEMEMKTPFASDKLEYGEYMVKVVMDQNNSFIDIVNLNESKKVINVRFMNKNVKRSIREKGWCLRPEVGIGYFKVNSCNTGESFQDGEYWYYVRYLNNSSVKYQLNMNLGFNVSKYVYFGVGTGISHFNQSLSAPLFFDSRIYFNDNRVSAFFDVKAGYYICLKSNNNYYPDNKHAYAFYNEQEMIISSSKYNLKGLVFSVEIGIEYKYSSISLSFGVQSDEMELTYYNYGTSSYQTMKIKNSLSDIYNLSSTGIMLRYGYNIYGMKLFK